MNELAKILNLTMSAVTAIIDKMIRRKLVKRGRSSEDRRVVNVTMVSKGRKLIKQVREIRCSCANELFASLTEQDKQEYLRRHPADSGRRPRYPLHLLLQGRPRQKGS